MTSAARMMMVFALATAGCSAAPQADTVKTVSRCSQTWLPIAGRVTDADRLLSEPEAALITKQLEALELATGHQLVVATVPTLQDQPIEDYSLCLANHWGIGRKGVNDGVLLLVARHERKVRIEVGTGLESQLTNAEAKEILDRTILPAFGVGNVAAGIANGIDDIAKQIS